MNKFFSKIDRNQKGFSMMEIAMVIVIFAITAGLSVLFYQSMQVRSDIASVSSSFVELARVSQGDSAAGKNGVNHGIHLETSKYTLFEGNTYNANASTNYVVTLPSSVSIQNISLNGGGSDIVFTSPKGETNNYGTFSFTSSQLNKSQPITITKIGTFNY